MQAAQPEIDGERGADRAAAHDDDVVMLVHVRKGSCGIPLRPPYDLCELVPQERAAHGCSGQARGSSVTRTPLRGRSVMSPIGSTT